MSYKGQAEFLKVRNIFLCKRTLYIFDNCVISRISRRVMSRISRYILNRMLNAEDDNLSKTCYKTWLIFGMRAVEKTLNR